MSDTPSDADSRDPNAPQGHDPWTQNPQQSTPKEPSHATADPADDANTLIERQRLAQVEMLDRWVGGVLSEQRRSRRWKLFFRFLVLGVVILVAGSLAFNVMSPSSPGPLASRPHLGLVKVEGVISADSTASAARIINGLNRAYSAQHTEAVVLHINSPGGSPVQSRRIFEEILRLREAGDKPIYAVVEDIGASGAYYIAAAADEIVASSVSLVGSIGVIYSGFGLDQAIEELGVERRVQTAGDNKAFLDPFLPMDDATKAFWQSVLDQTHQTFIDDVKRGRGERLEDDPSLFSGLVWSGDQALALGLIDRTGSLESLGRRLLGEPRYADYTPGLDPFDQLVRRITETALDIMQLSRSPSPLEFRLQAP